MIVDDSGTTGDAAMTLDELLLRSRSYRRFHQDRQLDKATLVQLVELVRRCPSAANRQPLKFLVSWQPERNALSKREELRMTNPTGPMSRIIVFLLMFLSCLAGARQSRAGIMEYLELMASRLTEESKPPATLAEWEAGREELREKYMQVIGLDPLPEKTPLHARLVGSAVDLVNDKIAGVRLEDAPDRHIGVTPVEASECETALFHILKYADIPQAAGLIFPRRIVLTGKRLAGFDWTKALYGQLGVGESFLEHSGSVKDLLCEIEDAPS